MRIMDLSEKEREIVEYVKNNRGCSISQISKKLNIDYKNAHRYCQKLYKEGILLISPSPSLKQRGIASKVSYFNIFNELAIERINKVLNWYQSKGEVDFKDFKNWFSIDKELNTAQTLALLQGYLKEYIKITPEGKKFLKEHSDK